MHVGMSYGDPNAGLHAAFAVLSALLYRERTGKGQYIDMSQWESTMAVLGEGIMDYTMNGTQPPRNGNRVAGMAPHGMFRCEGEDRWVGIACGTEEEWQALLERMDVLAQDFANDQELGPLYDAIRNNERSWAPSMRLRDHESDDEWQ